MSGENKPNETNDKVLKEIQKKMDELEKRAEQAEARALKAEKKAEKTAQVAESKEEEQKNALETISKEQKAFLEEKVPVQLMKDNNKYKHDLTVTHNGVNYQIQRGKPVMVPRFVAFILEESHRQEMVALELQEKLVKDYEKGRESLTE